MGFLVSPKTDNSDLSPPTPALMWNPYRTHSESIAQKQRLSSKNNFCSLLKHKYCWQIFLWKQITLIDGEQATDSWQGGIVSNVALCWGALSWCWSKCKGFNQTVYSRLMHTPTHTDTYTCCCRCGDKNAQKRRRSDVKEGLPAAGANRCAGVG